MSKVKFVTKVSDKGFKFEVADMSRQFDGYVTQDGSGAGIDLEAINAAERALDGISAGFGIWLEEDISALTEARGHWRDAQDDTEKRSALYRRAFDLQGQALTFGKPHIGDMANSLCLLLEHAEALAKLPAELVDAHVDAMRAAISQSGDDQGDTAAKELASVLRRATMKFLKKAGVDLDA